MEEIFFEQFITAAHRAGDRQLMLCSSGNMSLRVNDKILISGTGSWLPTIRKEQIAVLDLASGESLNGVKPSMEHRFHLEVLKNRPEMNVVLHFQSEYATAIACMKLKPNNFNVTAEIPCHIGREIPIIPYFRPGSPELAVAVSKAMLNHNCCLLSKHGQVACGNSFDDAFQKATFFEMACRIMVESGMNYEVLSEKELDDLDIYVLGKKH